MTRFAESSNLVNLFKFTVNKYVGNTPLGKLKKSKVFDMLTTLSFWFDDLTVTEIEKIQNEIDIHGMKLFTNIDIHEKIVGELSNDISTLFQEKENVIDPIVHRSYMLFRNSHYSLNFEGIHELLKYDRESLEIDNDRGV